jgi:formylglycine-generating enzyme required for sulfatase activity
MQAHRQTRTLLIGIAILSWTAPSIALGEWYAGTWDSCYNPPLEHPRTVAIRMELLDKDTHIPVRHVQVSLEGEYYQMRISPDIATATDVSWWNLLVDPNKREPQAKEFKLEAVSGSDGVVVFSLQWQKEFPWDPKIGDKGTSAVGDPWLLYADDVEKVQRLEIRHPRYRYVEAPLNLQHVVGLRQYLDPQRVVADQYKLFSQNWQNEIGRTNVKLFVLDLGTGFPEYKKQFCTRPEFFSRIRGKEYGAVYQVLGNLANMDDGKKCGPYFVYDLGEILLESIASRVEMEEVGASILTQDSQGEGTPWYRQYSRQPASATVARQETDIAPVSTRTATAGGIVVQDLDAGKKKEIDRVMGNPMGIIGVEVVRVDPFCPARDAGLRSGMIITSIKREEAIKRGVSLSMPELLVKTPTDADYFERLVAGFADGDSITLMVWRQSEGNTIRPGDVGSEEKGKWYQGYISFRHEQVPSEAVAGVSEPTDLPQVQDSGDGNQLAPPANGGRAPTGKTIDLGNGVSMEFVSIPPGSFSMGSPDSEKDSYGDEGPVRSVQITKAFYMGRYEVTQDQYMAVMGRNPSKFSGGNLPVETISWEEAVAFCGKIGGRLPTEAEWEYACRAGSETQFCYGDDPNYAQLGEYAWYPGNSGSRTHAIGQKKPNSLGLYDMHGNVYEWCSDWFAAYANEQTVDPVGPPSGQSRVCRGGGWRRFARYCRSAARNHSSPGSGGGLIGFRVALDAN